MLYAISINTELSPLPCTDTHVCKITMNSTTYFDVQADECNVVQLRNSSACMTAGADSHSSVFIFSKPAESGEPVCKRAETRKTSESICKKIDIVDQYLSDDDNPTKKSTL